MQKGWDATGRLRPLWSRVGGRDALARMTGIDAQTLSGYNSGRRALGEKNGRKLATALAVTIHDLGAPLPTGEQLHPILAEQFDQLVENLAALTRQTLLDLLREDPAVRQEIVALLASLFQSNHGAPAGSAGGG